MKNLIDKAKKFAKEKHKGQKQATGKSYFKHLLSVAKLLKKWGCDDEIVSAGLLHDVVEDCGVSLKEIEKNFGKRVSFLVDAMSFVLKIKNRKRKKDMDATYKKFVKWLKKEHSLAYIKVADMISNIPNIHELRHRKFVVNKSYPRLKMFWLPLIKELGFKKEAKKIENAFSKYTKKRIKSLIYDYISKKELNEIKKNIR